MRAHLLKMSRFLNHDINNSSWKHSCKEISTQNHGSIMVDVSIVLIFCKWSIAVAAYEEKVLFSSSCTYNKKMLTDF